MTKQEIINLLKERQTLIDNYNSKRYQDDDSVDLTIMMDDKVDAIEKLIVKEFLDNYDNFNFDFMFESITHFGYAPCLLYDDNGRFTIGGTIFQPVAIEPLEIESIEVGINNELGWSDTIKDCFIKYLKEIQKWLD